MSPVLPVSFQVDFESDNSTFLIKKGGSQRKYRFNQLNVNSVSITKADEILTSLVEAVILLTSLRKWLCDLQKRYEAQLGEDLLNFIKKERNMIHRISFLEQDVAFTHDYNTEESTFESFIVPIEVTIKTLIRMTDETIHWIDTGFRVGCVDRG